MTPIDLIRLDETDPAPIYMQIERSIRAAIVTGRITQGTQLPTVRQLAISLKVNANTVARVYSDLERQGVLQTRRGVGTFVVGHGESAPRQVDRQAVRDFAARVLEDAAARGFPLGELVTELQLQLKENNLG
jgi:GntR family transcriptional regulator